MGHYVDFVGSASVQEQQQQQQRTEPEPSVFGTKCKSVPDKEVMSPLWSHVRLQLYHQKIDYNLFGILL